MNTHEALRERQNAAFIHITSQSDELTELQVALYRAVDACLTLDAHEDAAVVLYVLERNNAVALASYVHEGTGSGEELPEIKERLRIYETDGIDKVPDPWGLL